MDQGLNAHLLLMLVCQSQLFLELRDTTMKMFTTWFWEMHLGKSYSFSACLLYLQSKVPQSSRGIKQISQHPEDRR